MFPSLSTPPDCHNREDDKETDLPQGADDEVEEDRASEDSIPSHRSSLGDAADAEFEQKINRLIAAKQKLRQLQNLAAMVQVLFKYKSMYKNIILIQTHMLHEIMNKGEILA